MTDDSGQLQLNASAAPDQGMAALRDVLKLVGAGLAEHGLVMGTTWQLVSGLIIAVAPVVWSQFVAVAKKKKMVELATTPARNINITGK